MQRRVIQIIIVYSIGLGHAMYLTSDFLLGIFIIGLMIYHIISIQNLNRTLEEDLDTSVRSLQYRLDKSIQEKKATLEQVLSLSDSFSFGLLMVDETGMIQLANKDLKDYFGLDLYHKSYDALKSIEKLHEFVHHSYILESKLRRQIVYNGADYDLIATPLYENKIFKGCFVIIHDITILKNAEKYQKQFTADVSHELKTPLSTIKGFSEILLRDQDIDVDKRNEFLELIQEESLRMERLLKDLMTIAQMDRVDYELELIKTPIHEALNETYTRLNRLMDKKNLSHSITVQPASLLIDPYKIRQVLTNLINNAINYTDQGSIFIEGSVEDENYVIKISDTGIGIEEHNIERIFKRFYRVDKTRSRKTGGSGLGLSISKNVIQRHGGSITVESEIDKGSTFIIRLPLKDNMIL
ncbi:MAG: HAMP domain-containing sensor histidine kinase [Candidatus Izemoplasma sp.]|nr:HAMP domain-containing sensor histidine kinase [Candidatus Izemoplasma sp.]